MKDLAKILPGVQKKVEMKNFTTYKIGGPARYFFSVDSEESLIKTLSAAKETKAMVFIMGNGSNILVSDKGFNGLVIKNNIPGIQLFGSMVRAGAGVNLNSLVGFCLENSLAGFEWAAGIPGTVGGAIFGNAQAFGTKISDSIKSVRALDSKTMKIKELSKKQCGFSLKSSIFKENKNLVIISADFDLKNGDKQEIQNRIKEHLLYRKNGHPAFPSAGSTFVNPEIKIKDKKILAQFPELNTFNERGVIPAGYLIQKSGLQGKKVGGAQISEKHANFIVNLGYANAKDIRAIIKTAKQKVKKNFGINLETEVQLVGFK